jgi:hypothetical protein
VGIFLSIFGSNFRDVAIVVKIFELLVFYKLDQSDGEAIHEKPIQSASGGG